MTVVELVELRLDEEEYERALAVLSEEEWTRVREMRSERKRRRFVAARAAVRTRLARELGIAAERVVVRVGEWGKPELGRVDEENKPQLGRASATKARSLPRFSVSHSDDLAAIAIRRGGEVGVDVERVRGERRADGRRVDWERLLARICGEREREQAGEDAERLGARMAFHTRWVAKEAVVKALGCGFRVAPAEVTLCRKAGALEMVGLYGRKEGSAQCTLVPFEAPLGFVGALALADGPYVDPGNLLAG
ncbi:MAG TPA: 4'-phosphopantetheinyl transferase superfamily protein [Solirubrobacteraceae bacterium]